MKYPFNIVDLSQAQFVPDEIDAQEPQPLRSFSEIWERDARWLTGPGLLSDIVNFLKTRHVVAEMGSRQLGVMTLTVPLPEYFDELTRSHKSVFYAVPEELRSTFNECYQEISESRLTDLERLRPLLYRQLSATSLTEANAMLRQFERERETRDRGQLWKVAAASFGFNPYMLPRPARLVT